MQGRGHIAFFNILGTLFIVFAIVAMVATRNYIVGTFCLSGAFISIGLGKFAYSKLPEEEKRRDREFNKAILNESERKLKYNIGLKEKFTETDRIGQLAIDDSHGIFKFDSLKFSLGYLDSKYFETKNLVSYEVNENNSTVTGSGLSVKRAVVGHLVAGPAGMVLGGLTGSRKSSEMIDSISITFNIVGNPMNKVELIKKPIEAGSIEHKNVVYQLNGIIDYFESVLEENRPDDIESKEQVPISDKVAETTPTDSITLLREYKKLLDEGIITQSDFDKKKSELLK